MKPLSYSSYKPSGVEWLGEVPEHWALRSLRYAATIQNGSDFKEFEVEEGGYPVLGSGGEFARISKFIYDQPSVLLGRKGTIDNPLFIEEPFWTVDTLFYTKIANDTHPKFFYWFCTSIPFGYFQYGSAVPSMTQNDLYGIKVPTPALEEQQTIADFLDAQTAKIDTLLAKKRQFIDKLKEKRSALIARTVTRGLPPAAAQAVGLEPHPAMKDSGVEWVGDIPSHWNVRPIRYLFKNLDSKRIPLSGEDRTTLEKLYPYYGASGIIDQVDEYIFDEQLILVAEDGANLLSRSLPLAFLATGKYWVNNHAHILRPIIGDISYWVSVLQTFDFTPLVTGAAQPKLTADRLGSIRLPVPPVEEQQAIAAYLDRETARIDQLTTKVEAAIERLTEYRQALITAAVTGKIDVRQYNMQKGAQHATVTLS